MINLHTHKKFAEAYGEWNPTSFDSFAAAKKDCTQSFPHLSKIPTSKQIQVEMKEPKAMMDKIHAQAKANGYPSPFQLEQFHFAYCSYRHLDNMLKSLNEAQEHKHTENQDGQKVVGVAVKRLTGVKGVGNTIKYSNSSQWITAGQSTKSMHLSPMEAGDTSMADSSSLITAPSPPQNVTFSKDGNKATARWKSPVGNTELTYYRCYWLWKDQNGNYEYKVGQDMTDEYFDEARDADDWKVVGVAVTRLTGG